MTTIISLTSFILFAFIAIKPALAVCPVCIVAVGIGLGVSRWLGIDDTVTGVWIGGLIVASALWLAGWIEKRGWKIPYTKILSIVLLYALTIIPLWLGKTIGHPQNTLWGIDKILLGIITGSIAFSLSVWLDKILGKLNNGQVYIYYQKMILPMLLLTLASFTFYLLS
ncbi:hypothetical protein KKC62_01250 [Patescibacteria group bacterium]|nr:hypothetical protein [Patescibacteria group bacterium]MBU1952826.1 hypothetical protein [Patescibacteria group bacterium]